MGSGAFQPPAAGRGGGGQRGAPRGRPHAAAAGQPGAGLHSARALRGAATLALGLGVLGERGASRLLRCARRPPRPGVRSAAAAALEFGAESRSPPRACLCRRRERPLPAPSLRPSPSPRPPPSSLPSPRSLLYYTDFSLILSGLFGSRSLSRFIAERRRAHPSLPPFLLPLPPCLLTALPTPSSPYSHHNSLAVFSLLTFPK
jgi:hypothetical protein